MKSEIMNIAHEVFALEAAEIAGLSKRLTTDFQKAIEAILACKGKTIITGMGKSGIIGKKIAATLASTGTPSFFVHPGEAYHGDLGMIGKEDVVIAISNSGETEEVLRLISYLEHNGNTLIAMTGKPKSTLARCAHFHLDVGVEKEACPLQLAPTSSTTATLVMGDALAVALIKMRGFEPKDFAQYHPGGSLGRRLLTTVEKVMKKTGLPKVAPADDVKVVIHAITRGRCGLAVVVSDDDAIAGIITDGDIRRAMDAKEEGFFALKAKDLMTANPKMVEKTEKLSVAEERMAEYKINSLLVIHKEKFVGIVQIYDIQNKA